MKTLHSRSHVLRIMPLVDTDRLQSVARFARNYQGRKKKGVAVGYIYQLIKEGKLEHVEIDGIFFVVLPEPPEQATADMKQAA